MIKLLRRADLLDAALVHHTTRSRVIASTWSWVSLDRRRLHLLMHALDLGDASAHELGVEIGQGSSKEDLRVAHDGAPHGDALALSARQRLWGGGRAQSVMSEDARRVLDALADLRLGEFAQPQGRTTCSLNAVMCG